MRTAPAGSLLACLLLSAGCAARAYQPAPISPPASAASFSARTLADPGLKIFIEDNLHGALPVWPPESWDLTMLTLAAFYYHPDLDVARAQLAQAEAAVVTAGEHRNPSIKITPGRTMDVPSPWLMSFNFSLPLETAGKRGYRIARARHLAESARVSLAVVGWQVRQRVRGALLDRLTAQRTRQLLGNELQARTRILTLMERRVTAGEAGRVDLASPQTALAETTLAAAATEGRIVQARAALAAAIGVPETSLATIAVSWPDLDSPPAESTLPEEAIQRAAVLNRLDIHRSLAEYDAADAALRLEIAKQFPDLAIGPTYELDEGANKFFFGLLSVTLPLRNRTQGPIAEAEARRIEAAARVLSAQARGIGESAQALARYRAALVALADASLQTIAARQTGLIRRRVALGEADQTELAATIAREAVAEMVRLAAAREAQVALGVLEDAIQRPLPLDASEIRADRVIR